MPNAYELLGIKPPQGQPPDQPAPPSTSPQPQRPDGGGFMETLRQIGGVIDPVGEYVSSTLAGEKPRLEGQAAALRVAPGLIPNPALSGAASAAGEYLAQGAENVMGTRKELDPESIALAGAIPPAMGVTGRVVRGGVRTAQRLMPTLFERAQGAAGQAGREAVESLRPTVDVGQLARSARAAGGDLIPSKNIQNVINGITLPATPANPRAQAVRTTIDNLQAVMSPTGEIPLVQLEAVRRDIGPLLRSAPAELSGIYGGIVKDLESAAASGGVGADLARQAATAFKQDLGASLVGNLIDKATTVRMTSGAQVPALNVATLMRLSRQADTRKQLMDNLGPEGVRVIDQFVQKFRGLPPDMAYNAMGRTLGALGGGFGSAGGAMTIGGGLGLGAGAAVGALSPEVIANMAFVGRNPQALNRLLSTVGQGMRAAAPPLEEWR